MRRGYLHKGASALGTCIIRPTSACIQLRRRHLNNNLFPARFSRSPPFSSLYIVPIAPYDEEERDKYYLVLPYTLSLRILSSPFSLSESFVQVTERLCCCAFLSRRFLPSIAFEAAHSAHPLSSTPQRLLLERLFYSVATSIVVRF